MIPNPARGGAGYSSGTTSRQNRNGSGGASGTPDSAMMVIRLNP
jgi:hypothetical protein